MGDYNGDLKVVINQQTQVLKKIDKIDAKLDDVCDTVIRHDERIIKHTEQIGKIDVKQGKNDFVTKWIGGLSAFFGMVWTLALIYLGLKEG